MGSFAKNQWYAAAWLSELTDAPLARRILDEPVVLFRTPEGTVSALLDRCPHRLVPLSMGTVTGRGLQCGYHGMTFGGNGRCVHIPGQDTIPPQAQVPSYPIEERYGIAWIWMGEADQADRALLPDIPYHDDPDWERIDGGYQHHPSNYLNIVENLMDPAHTTFVHKQTIGNPAAADTPVTMERTDEHIVAYKWLKNSPPSQMDVKIKDFGDEKVDRGIFFYFIIPSTSRVDVITMPAGLEPTEENYNKGLRNNSYKFLTPESETSTHFFWMHLRNYKVGDKAWSERMRGVFEQTFLEDRDIEMAMQSWQNEVGVRQFVGLEIDRAPTIALRMIGKMVKDEKAERETAVA
ncbi:aromatic ring-hydroxylating dioxygenase subunit alpha [Stakelama sp. CBK3Z-3]|uniref:Aromatic ring-hydroxylating dioxygenase subunit alpha n=1 Tax=Stakelama flava TaxID=2860338 RepID=A0ABS6XPU5_9SPHN|nr:aromatic ring-hydroxylating dioxygenase subunit alpha [Stakelama flava]MBW4332136.1 aromatic ring-hydroxylating dioxygenase subunit alpha [Stakelama flava]